MGPLLVEAWQQTLHVAGYLVHLDVHAIALGEAPERRALERLRDQRDLYPAPAQRCDREADPADCDRAVLERVAFEACGELEGHSPRDPVRDGRDDLAHTVDVPLHEVAAQGIA